LFVFFDRSSLVDEPYVVNNTYEAKTREEISLQQGSFVTVREKSYTGWWIVQYEIRIIL